MSAPRAALLLLAVVALAGCGGRDEEPTTSAEPREAVTDLDNVLQLRSDFEADQGKTRLLVLLSPT